MMLKGDLVFCISAKHRGKEFLELTPGKPYDVLMSVDENWIQIINDIGEKNVYASTLFQKVPHPEEVE